MARRQQIPEFRETGKLAEEFLGGDSVKPENDLMLAKKMLMKGQLLSGKYKGNPRYKEQIKMLKIVLPQLLILAKQHEESPNPRSQEEIRLLMLKLKKRFNHDLLFEVLVRFTINAHPDKYTPWEPGPIKGGRPRNEFITDLQEKICEYFGTTDYNKVRFYNAAGTPLDILYSTDGFFVIDGSLFPDHQRRLLPIDVTISTSKEMKDFNPSGSLILHMDAKNLDDERLKNYRDSFARKIASTLLKTKPDHTLDGFKSKFDEGELA